MLTVKHIDIRGNETLYEVQGVRLIKSTLGDKLQADFADDHAGDSIVSGTVFVMNRHGSTVARYDLSASPVPLEKPVLAGDDYTARVA